VTPEPTPEKQPQKSEIDLSQIITRKPPAESKKDIAPPPRPQNPAEVARVKDNFVIAALPAVPKKINN
jgi:hypothetical protein